MLFGVVLGLSGFFKTREEGKAVIDDFPFRLFYGFSCGILFLCTALVGIQDLVGKNIDCYKGSPAVNQYCWVTGTHLLVDSKDERGLGAHFLGEERCSRNDDGHWTTKEGISCIKTHSYYQWVPYVLLLQGCLFYLPRLFWLSFEEGKMSSVSEGIRLGTNATSANRGEKLKNVAANVANYINLKEAGHTSYGWAYIAAQVMNLIVLCFVFWFDNVFLDHQFHDLGFRWLSAVFDDDVDSTMLLYRTFPRLTKCEFQTFGKGGDINSNEHLCILAPNIISEKIFVFLWFWYIILGIITAINVIVVALMAFRSQNIRSVFMMRAVFSRKLKHHISANDQMKHKIEQMEFGKFLFLYLLGRNVDYFVYKTILDLVTDVHDDDNGPSISNADADASINSCRLTRELSRPDVKDTGSDEVMPNESLPVYPIYGRGEDEQQDTITRDFPLRSMRSKE